MTALAAAKPTVFWTDRPDAPGARERVRGPVEADLVIVGGGFTGLWAAILALQRDPGRRVVVVEATVIGDGASSRNGGMVDPSVAHGAENASLHWPEQTDTLARLGDENFEALRATIDDHGIDCDYRSVSWLNVATEQWQLDALEAAMPVLTANGKQVELLDGDATQEKIASSIYIGALRLLDHGALVDPARLVWGLAELAERLGAVLYDHSAATAIEPDGDRLVVGTETGQVSAERVLVATNAWRGPVRQMNRYVAAVYDHVLVTEPLTEAQMASVGWHGWEGIDETAHQFHYLRRTADRRILWGGYDANHHWRSRVDARFDQHGQTHQALATQFFDAFPQLEGLDFSHRWGGPIGTTTRFTAAWGTRFDGRLSWVGGYTGLGVAASRFGARVALDLLDGRASEATDLDMVRRKPFPFPAEPFRSAAIAATKASIRYADRHEGRENLWLKMLGRFGVGFDS